ncbi:MAG TPA: hypothetical protein VGX96_18270 [Candidatus Elarobacter sp.]|nr:hypothetical protein [Candidatus Elarobacter sp.]
MNGTVVSVPHCAQTASNISRRPAVEVGAAPRPFVRWDFRTVRQSRHRCGSFSNPFSA